MPNYARTVRYRHRRRKKRAMLRTIVLILLLVSMIAVGWLIGLFAGIIHDNLHPGVYTVVVDAGHGGTDCGANGVIRECDMTAKTAQLLIALLEQDTHFRASATRRSYDASATPSERSTAANRAHADLLLSIHGNSDGGAGSAAGFECYPVTPGHEMHDESMRFASILVSRMSDAGASVRGENGIRYAYYDENNQKVIVEGTDEAERSETTFTLLERSRCPAVLAEQCFVTSAADVDAFGDEDGCARAADCYYRAICEYFDVTPYSAGTSDSPA